MTNQRSEKVVRQLSMFSGRLPIVFGILFLLGIGIAFSSLGGKPFQVQAFMTGADAALVQESGPVFVEPRIPSNGGPARSETREPQPDFVKHVGKLARRIPGPEFHVVVQKPFVVIGDERREVVEQRSRQTVKWAVDLLKKDYFTRDPEAIIDIWLFKDKASYEKHNVELFGEVPSTPFGFYSSTHRALVMNISTGGGTLVHEIVHPFIESNFERCPSWFNEGLASLYEQCREKDGHIWGSTNWRLRGLQGAIESKRLGSFQTLCSTTTREFYDDPSGTNYAQARYLCYYLQEKGVLVEFYKRFKRDVAVDPTGYKTLAAVLGNPDMKEFEEKWKRYVANLRF